MNTKVCIGRFLVMLSLLFSGAAMAKGRGGDGVGNGGYVPENHFISIGYDWLDALTKAEKLGLLPPEVRPQRLAELLRVTHIKFKHGVMLNGEPKSAVNFPKMNLITPDFADWDAAPDEGKYLLVLHEFLPPMGVNDNLGQVSIPLMKLARARNLLSIAKPQADAPQLLYSIEYDSERQGLDFFQAEQLCRYHKELNEGRYYFVYCVYLEKIWFQDEKVVTHDSDEEWVQPVNAPEGVGLPGGQFDQIVRRRHQRPHQLMETRSYSAYGLRVFGLGIEAELQFKVVASSLNLVDGLAFRDFATEREAYRACRTRMTEANDQSVRYYRATCRAPRNVDSGRYYYEIVTKNPLIP